MQRNGFFAHSEALLLAMLADSDEEIRTQAVETILEIRSKASSGGQLPSCSIEGDCLDEHDDDDEEEVQEGDEEDHDDEEVEEGEADDAFTWEPSERNAILTANVRKYLVPKINFDATSYTQLIDLQRAGITEPPLTLDLSDTQISAFKTTPFEVPNYPCHTQAVERAVRLVSQASSKVVGQKARDGYIRQRIRARKELKKFATKQDFFPKIEAYSRSD